MLQRAADSISNGDWRRRAGEAAKIALAVGFVLFGLVTFGVQL